MPNQSPITFSDRMRVLFKGVLDAIGGFFNSLGVSPNTMTLIGVAGNAVAAVLLGYGYIVAGGVVFLAMGLFDALDGTMARLRNNPTAWGGFLDSVSDRYSELMVYGGLLVYYALHNSFWGVAFAYGAASGSVLVSYTRARAASLGAEVKIGLFTRLERFLVLSVALVLNHPIVGMSVIAVGAHFTALQRVSFTHKILKSQNR